MESIGSRGMRAARIWRKEMRIIKNTFIGRLSVALLLTLSVALSLSAQTGLSAAERKLAKGISVEYIKNVTVELSDDRFEGRGTLQRGGDLAASWIADRMKSLGLKPGGDKSTYLQSIPFVETVLAESSAISIGGENLVYAKDWSGLLAETDQTGQAVFVGYGLSSPALGRDDLKNADLKGKIAVYIEGPAKGTNLTEWNQNVAPLQLLGLIQRGVKAIFLVTNGRELYKRDFIIDMTGRRQISSPGDVAQTMPLPIIYLSEAAAEKIFAGSGFSRAQAVERAESADFTPIELKPPVKISIRKKRTEANAYNVIGLIEGSDPALKNEAVVFTAHYDAYGLMNGKIYNGAADNAIGNGEMLAVARAFSKMKTKPRRTLIFISTTAEEYGLLGSKFYAENPTWDITKIAAVLNLDGIGSEIMGPVINMVGYGGDFSTLGPMFNEVARSYGIQPMSDPIPEQGVFGRSDHYPFVTRGVPGLMLVGSPSATKEDFVKKFDEFENSKYHQPSDDVYDNWYWKGAKTVADMMGILGLRIAEARETPSFTGGNPYSGLKRGDRMPAK